MDLRTRIQTATKEAMKARDSARTSTLRLIAAAIKDREIALRGEKGPDAVLDGDGLLAILAKMVKQRQESARAYVDGGRRELADKELAEVELIQSFMPRQLDAAEVEAAIGAAITALGATSLRDMGKVMAELRARHAGQMDFATVGPQVKARLG